MTIVVSIPQQAFTPQTINTSVTIGAGVKRLVFSATRVAWPAGAVGTIGVTMPDGTSGPQCGFAGGIAFQKDGVTVALVSGMTVEGNMGASLPVGTYPIQIGILQTVTTAVIVESF